MLRQVSARGNKFFRPSVSTLINFYHPLFNRANLIYPKNTKLICNFKSFNQKYSTEAPQNDYNYAEIVENTLESLSEKFTEIEDHVEIPGFDVSCSDGVLKLDLGPHGQYVINKQPPNKQLWISSPVW